MSQDRDLTAMQTSPSSSDLSHFVQAIWLVLLLFVLSIWWRQRKVNTELEQLQQKVEGQS